MLHKKLIITAVSLATLISGTAYAAKHTHSRKSHYVPPNQVEQLKIIHDSDQPVAATDVHINIASAKELMSVKGIGAKRAAAIISYRKKNGPLHSVDDLAKIKGIGKAGLASLRKHNHKTLVL